MPMLNGYSPESLEKVINLQDVIKFRLGRNREEIKEKLSKVSYAISDPYFKFDLIKSKPYKNQILFSTNSIEEHVALKALDRSIRLIYQVKFTTRSSITKCMILALKDRGLHSIARLDFKSFFEKVPRKRLVEKLVNDSLLSQELISILIKIDAKLTELNYKGLPRGLSISSTLAEIYLRDLDRNIKSLPSTYYYARYVDDIIIISKSNTDFSHVDIEKRTSDLGLTLNLEKSSLIDKNKPLDFDYLGFNFKFESEILCISLSLKKVKKIKTRIVNSILDYGKNKDADLLIKRILFLTTNHNIFRNGEISELKSGIYFTNQVINNYSSLSELDEFLRKSITAKRGSFARNTMSIPDDEKKTILKMSFFQGFITKKTVNFSNQDHQKIKECWKHD